MINNLTSAIVPSDVFGWEVNTDVGYGRETFTLTLGTGEVARVGTVMEVDYEAKTATVVDGATLTDADAVKALGDLVVFVGRDIKTVATKGSDFDNLVADETGKVVGITRGDGRGTLYKKYLDFKGTSFESLDAAVRTALTAKFTTENRFKVLDAV